MSRFATRLLAAVCLTLLGVGLGVAADDRRRPVVRPSHSPPPLPADCRRSPWNEAVPPVFFGYVREPDGGFTAGVIAGRRPVVIVPPPAVDPYAPHYPYGAAVAPAGRWCP